MVPGSPHLPGRVEKEGVPWAQRPLADLGLLGGVKGRNHCAGHHNPAMHHMGQSLSRCIQWSSPRAP